MNQMAFARAILDPEMVVPDGIVGPDGRAAPKRFSVYRNNVVSSLTKALEAAFPTVRALVGAEFFAAMAGVFLRTNPPRSRILMLYGTEFPAFLEQFPPVAHLGYLPDVARLEQAIRESYHAADAPAITRDTLAMLGDDALLDAVLDLAPSLRLVRSPWPIHAIWAANANAGPPPRAGAEDVVVLRPEYDPQPQLLLPGGGAVVAGLLTGMTLRAAHRSAGENVDLAAVLVLLASHGAIVGVRT